ncbi:MAG: recombinase family protein, partial [Anaerobutyricum soehngenii]
MSDRIGALYIRVSTDDQAELSPDAQKRLLLDYAKKNGIIISNDFIFSESVSGRHVQKRPEFQRMIGIAKQPSHPIDVILVWKYSRFARNQEESIVYKSMLKKDHVDVISISEPLIDGPFGSLIERIIEWMDEYYSIRLSGEVLRGMKEKALRNGYQSSPCLGYEAVGHGNPYQINEAEYAMVSYIMDLYDNHNMDETAIARKCNDLGYKTKRGNPFERRTIDRILQNPFYCGIVSWNGVEFEGAHEVRISKERFDRRQRLIASRKRPMKARNVSTCKHWLSGLLKCSVCGATLSYTGNGKCPYFQCWKYAKGFHKTSVALSVKKAEEAVISYFDQILSGTDFTYVRKDQPATDETVAIEQLQKELSKLSTREIRIRDAYESGIDSLEEYKAN